FYNHPRLGAADYRLVEHTSNGRTIYTFCMCPGGSVIASASEEGQVVTNGMSEHARDKENANSAVLVNVTPEDFGSEHPLAGIYFQEKYEKLAFECGGRNYKAPIQLVGDFLNNRVSTKLGSVNPSYKPGYKFVDLTQCLPEFVCETMKEGLILLDNKLKGFAMEDAILTGVETRSSAPIRIVRDEETLESANVKGLYPSGEGAGYAGGIVTLAIDGIKCAEKIIENYSKIQ
ncbi:MAG: NAD(P)/FAD-dependent oxidoreductase, partial [Paeniclostridium sp.]